MMHNKSVIIFPRPRAKPKEDAENMPSHMTHAQMLALWPRRSDLARALSISYPTIQSWELRDNIPEQHWESLVELAAAEGVPGITIGALRIAAMVRSATKPTRRNVISPRDA